MNDIYVRLTAASEIDAISSILLIEKWDQSLDLNFPDFNHFLAMPRCLYSKFYAVFHFVFLFPIAPYWNIPEKKFF